MASERAPVALVHGYRFDPADSKHDPHTFLYPIWREQLAGRRVRAFAWYSAPSLKGTLGAWLRGHPTSYAWAYRRLAVTAAERLASELKATQHHILCHSLGSRVALRAIALGAPVRCCTILAGAELSRRARPIALAHPAVRFVNVYAKADAVIDGLAENFTPGGGFNAPALGNDGMSPPLPNWTDVVLDDPAVQAWGAQRGWHLAGDDPEEISDHDHAWKHEGNWDLIRAAFEGDCFEGLPIRE